MRISDAELASIPGLSCEWCEQPAIIHSYVRFGHFILGKENGMNQYYLGIPDIYHPSRQKILEIERIECFKTRDGSKTKIDKIGYWIARL